MEVQKISNIAFALTYFAISFVACCMYLQLNRQCCETHCSHNINDIIHAGAHIGESVCLS